MMVQTSEARAAAMSPLGVVSLHVSGSSDTAIEVARAEIPELPEDMAVDGAILFRVRFAMPVTRDAPVRLTMDAGRDGDPETGQWLDSMAFTSAEGVLQVAMRDDEWLAHKGVIAELVRYGRQGFSQIINEAPAGTALYVSMAWRVDNGAAAADDCSTWFAADLLLPA